MALDLIVPRRLRAGDRIAAVTLSWGGPGALPHRYLAGKRQLEEALGVAVVEMPHTMSSAAEVAANPRARAADLMAAFADPSIAGVISTIGGEDSIRILPYLDLDVIRRNPKVFLGYSDTTVTHLACLQAGLRSYYGPAVMAGFGENGGLFPYMLESVRRTLFSGEAIGTVTANPDAWVVEPLSWQDPANQTRLRRRHPTTCWRFLQGAAPVSGHLLGGCVDVLEIVRGCSAWPSLDAWNGAILFLETSEEAMPPARLARALRSYAAVGVLDRVAGILYGRPGGADVDPATFSDYDDAILGVVAWELGRADLPIVTGMDFGHTDPMFVIPYGARATIDPVAHTFTIDEPGVR